MFIILSYIYTQPTGAPTIDPVKVALEKRAVDAESKLDTVNDELVTCTLGKQEVAEVAKKSLEDVNTLKKQLESSQAETKQVTVDVTKLKEEAERFKALLTTSQEELNKSRDEAKKAAETSFDLKEQLGGALTKLVETQSDLKDSQIDIKKARAAVETLSQEKKIAAKEQARLKKLAANLKTQLTKSQAEATQMKTAADELKARTTRLAQSLKKSEKQATALQARLEKSQVEAAAKLQGLQAAVCTEIAQVESAQTKVAEKAKQALLEMETAMKEMTLSCVPEAPVDVVYKQESEKLNEVKDFQVQGLTSLTSKEFNDAVKYIPQNVNFKLQEFNDASPQDKLFYEAKNVEDIEPVVLKPASKEAASVAFDLSKLDQQQDVKQNELEEELNRASGKVEFSYLAKNAAEEQYVQISRQDVISRAQDGLGAQCSASTQKFIELAVAMITGDHKDTAINVIGRDQTADLVTYRGQLTDLIGRDQELIDITGKDQVIELEPVNDIDLSSLVSIVGCGAVKKQQLVKVDSGNFPFEVVKYPLVSEKDAKYDGTSLQYVKAEVDNTDTDGN